MESEPAVTIGGLLDTMEVVVKWLYNVPADAGGGERWQGLLDEIEGLRKQLHEAAKNLGHEPMISEEFRARLLSSKIGVPC